MYKVYVQGPHIYAWAQAKKIASRASKDAAFKFLRKRLMTLRVFITFTLCSTCSLVQCVQGPTSPSVTCSSLQGQQTQHHHATTLHTLQRGTATRVTLSAHTRAQLHHTPHTTHRAGTQVCCARHNTNLLCQQLHALPGNLTVGAATKRLRINQVTWPSQLAGSVLLAPAQQA